MDDSDRERIAEQLLEQLEGISAAQLLRTALASESGATGIMVSPTRSTDNAMWAVFAVVNPETIQRLHHCIGVTVEAERRLDGSGRSALH
jgi:outer membrane PBP1 activator LpoA protein